jgi:hypothetical protein
VNIHMKDSSRLLIVGALVYLLACLGNEVVY